MCESPGWPGNTIGSSGPKWSIAHSICQSTLLLSSPGTAWAAGTANPSTVKVVAAMASGLVKRFRPNIRNTFNGKQREPTISENLSSHRIPAGTGLAAEVRDVLQHG